MHKLLFSIALLCQSCLLFGQDVSKDTMINHTQVKPFFKRYSVYEPNYFLTNFGQNDFGQVKFKVSFKYDLGFNFDKWSKRFQKDGIYFAYTQTAFWDIYDYSAPMRDVNFSPLAYWQHQVYGKRKNHSKKFFLDNYKVGYLHKSNGQPNGANNRSIFQSFSHFNFIWSVNPNNSAGFKLVKADLNAYGWIWNMLADENKNIADYDGYGQLVTTLHFDYSNLAANQVYPLEISNVTIPAKHAISTVFNLIYDPFIHSLPWFPYLYMQYWHGYGESLLNYDNRYNGGKPENIFRMGVQFRVN